MKQKAKRRTKIVAIVLGAIVVVAVLIITVAGGAFMPRNYLDPWEKDYHQRFDDPRMQVVAHGILAANSHNMQPWRIELDEVDTTSFRLFTDGERLTPQVDPVARQITISQGTFLEYAVVAAAKLGYACDIELFPEGEYDLDGTPASMAEKPVAEVSVRGDGAAPVPAPEPGASATTVSEPPASGAVAEQTTGLDLLYDCLFLPDTVRAAYDDTALTEEQAARLTEWTPDPSVEIVLSPGSRGSRLSRGFGDSGSDGRGRYQPHQRGEQRALQGHGVSEEQVPLRLLPGRPGHQGDRDVVHGGTPGSDPLVGEEWRQQRALREADHRPGRAHAGVRDDPHE